MKIETAKKILNIHIAVRWILTAVLLYGAYTETGAYTMLTLFLIVCAIEIKHYPKKEEGLKVELENNIPFQVEVVSKALMNEARLREIQEEQAADIYKKIKNIL